MKKIKISYIVAYYLYAKQFKEEIIWNKKRKHTKQ